MLLSRLKNDNTPELALNELQFETMKQVSSKVDKGVYQFEEIVCPICNAGEKEVIGEKDRYGLYFKTNICTGCGLVYTSPRMTQESYNQFYNIEYRKLYVGTETATQTFFERQGRKGEEIYHFLEENGLIKQEPLNVFEVGCGAGGILDFFRKKGHVVKGIDLGEEYVAFGKDVYNLDLEVGFLSDCEFATKPDIIIYSHVLEHILDLNQELQVLREIADDNTLVYIEVPGIKEIHKNYESNILTYFQNAHTFHFTLETLTNLFSINGFKMVCGNQFVQSVFKPTHSSGKEIKSDFVESKQYMLETEKKFKKYPYTLPGIKRNLRRMLGKVLDITKTRKLAKYFKNLLVAQKS